MTIAEAVARAETTNGGTRVPLVDALAPHLVAASASSLSMPEHRQLEMYSRPLQLTFAEEEAGGLPLAEIAGACRAFVALDAAIAPRDADTEGGVTWERYSKLPRRNGIEKIAAELYRALRLIFVVATDRSGHIEWRSGLIHFDRLDEASTVTMKLTPAGLSLLQSAVVYFLDARRSLYPDAYVEAMLSEYYADIVGELRGYCDENKSLYQFRRKLPLNRHLRLDCDNPKTRIVDDALHIEIFEAYRDPQRFPIDFFLIHDEALHVIPVEALADARLPLAQLAQWRARLADGDELPALFRSRFSRGRRF